MVEVVNIIKSLVQNMPYTINVKGIVLSDGVYSITTCNTSYISERQIITIDGDTYEVSDVVVNDSFKLTPTSDGVIDLELAEITLPPIGFYSGTLKDIDGERGAAKRMNLQETPFCWLREPFTINRNYDRSSPMFGDVDLEIYFMGECDPDNMLAEDHRKEVIYPMHNIADVFFKYIRDVRVDVVNEIDRCVIRELSNLGTQGANGMNERLFDENLSGVECRTTLTLEKLCKNC
jgi:hypothetical protein